MAVPKKKVSYSRKKMRNSHTKLLTKNYYRCLFCNYLRPKTKQDFNCSVCLKRTIPKMRFFKLY